MDITQRNNLQTLAKEIDDFILAKEVTDKRKAQECGFTNTSMPREIARARKVLEEWSGAEHVSPLEGCSNIRESFFKLFLEARARSRSAKVLSEPWLESEEVAYLYLELSKIPTRFLTAEKIQQMASQERMESDESAVKHDSP